MNFLWKGGQNSKGATFLDGLSIQAPIEGGLGIYDLYKKMYPSWLNGLGVSTRKKMLSEEELLLLNMELLTISETG